MINFIIAVTVCFSFLKIHSSLLECSIPTTYCEYELNEIGFSQFLELLNQYLPTNPSVIEAGAFDGNQTSYLATHWPEGIIYSFEPVSGLYDQLVKRTQGLGNVRTYPFALGETEGLKIIHLSVDSEIPEKILMSSSFYEPHKHKNFFSAHFKGFEEVRVVRLDHWASTEGIEKIDLLCLDVQGYELSILKSAEKVLSQVSALIVELNFEELYKGQPLYQEVISFLEEKGFQLIAGTFQIPVDKKAIFGDGLFVKNELILRKSPVYPTPLMGDGMGNLVPKKR